MLIAGNENSHPFTVRCCATQCGVKTGGDGFQPCTNQGCFNIELLSFLILGFGRFFFHCLFHSKTFSELSDERELGLMLRNMLTTWVILSHVIALWKAVAPPPPWWVLSSDDTQWNTTPLSQLVPPPFSELKSYFLFSSRCLFSPKVPSADQYLASR